VRPRFWKPTQGVASAGKPTRRASSKVPGIDFHPVAWSTTDECNILAGCMPTWLLSVCAAKLLAKKEPRHRSVEVLSWWFFVLVCGNNGWRAVRTHHRRQAVSTLRVRRCTTRCRPRPYEVQEYQYRRCWATCALCISGGVVLAMRSRARIESGWSCQIMNGQ